MTTPIITAAQFRQDFPAFANSAVYPDSQINFYVTWATNQMSGTLFGTMLPQAMELFVAHNLSIESQSQKDGSVGGQPGGFKGPVSSKGVDKVNISYDTNAVIEKDAGHWNLTTYGVRLKRLMDMVGAGGIQVAGGIVDGNPCGVNFSFWSC